MNRLLTPLIATSLIAFAAPVLAAAQSYQFDPNHTNVYWHANHFGFSNPGGKFGAVTGTLDLDEAAPQNTKVNATIAIASLATGIEKFDTHLKSADFLNSEKFSTATFISDKVEVTGQNTAKLTGMLTLLGVAKPITLDVTMNKIGENPMTKKKVAGFSATGVIKRSDFGISFGIPNVSDEVKIDVEVEATL